MADHTRRISPDGVIDVMSDGEGIAAKDTSLSTIRKRLHESSDKENGDNAVDKKPKIETFKHSSKASYVHAPNERTLPPVASLPSTVQHDDDDDADVCDVVGTVNSIKLPHMRQHCTVVSYVAGDAAKNKLFCDECYCYVCDTKAGVCGVWNHHCEANDKGPCSDHWKAQRDAVKKSATATPKPPPEALSGNEGSLLPPRFHYRHACPTNVFNFPKNAEMATYNVVMNERICLFCYCYICHKPASHCNNWKFEEGLFSLMQMHCNASPLGCHEPCWERKRCDFHFPGAGPFKPDNPLTASLSQLETCCKCQWFLKKRTNICDPVKDYCKACGRVAHNNPTCNFQTAPYEHVNGNIFLGSKELPFRLHARDPRKAEAYEARWEDAGNGWVYDEKEMRQDLFSLRIGERPRLAVFSNMIPIVSEEKIPHEWCHAMGCDAILFDSEMDASLVRELILVSPDFAEAQKFGNWVTGDLQANWSPALQKGSLTVNLYLNPSRRPQDIDIPALIRLLGCWYDTFPVGLDELCALMTPEYKANNNYDSSDYLTCMRVPPFEMNIADTIESRLKAGEIRVALAKDLDMACKARKAAVITMKSSSGHTGMGGICTNETDFHGIVKRYLRETFADSVKRLQFIDHEKEWIEHENGALSFGGKFTSILFDRSERALATTHFEVAAAEVFDQTRNLTGMMIHLENRGHDLAEVVEGLTVELLPFQLQSLKWALERETTLGGIQRFWCPKLPSVAEPGTELYLNVLLGEISVKEPDLVRGGIIAEQMGLGKTVISLALILSNPAPAEPMSGASVDSIPAFAPTGAPFRDPKLHDRTVDASKKRGTILSRGTLVICNVSLVGQWIDEAKSKLNEPGLVYSYHGSTRRRDSRVLAENSIVVTTYETLSSDLHFHGPKSGLGQEYCAPCEQVRWWRIICDESHVLRSGSTKKAIAVFNLVADNKWLVSGTPVNTSLLDLENQLEFLGIERSKQIMNVYRKSTCLHVGEQMSRRQQKQYIRYAAPEIGHFTFLMRSILIRHSQKQEYEGTSTTLMSLPPKTERIVEVYFNDADLTEYADLESRVRAAYIAFRGQHGRHNLSKHYLAQLQKLAPLRVACAGGQVSIDDAAVDDDEDDSVNEEDVPTKRKKVQQLSDYCFTSKLDKLLAELKRVRDENVGAKSLVFSQFTSTLKWLQRELPKHGFDFRTLSGDMSMSNRAKALRDFRNDPPTTVFLLSMRAGAVGINLTQANRVFIMEPCFNPALEAQAIGRVHRLGQTRAVEITRLVMANSVETRIRAMIDKKYGAAVNTETDNIRGDFADADKKLPAQPSILPVAVGSLKTDKASATADDFDLLFDAPAVTVEAGHGEDMENDDGAPDFVGSSS